MKAIIWSLSICMTISIGLYVLDKYYPTGISVLLGLICLVVSIAIGRHFRKKVR